MSRKNQRILIYPQSATNHVSPSDRLTTLPELFESAHRLAIKPHTMIDLQI